MSSFIFKMEEVDDEDDTGEWNTDDGREGMCERISLTSTDSSDTGDSDGNHDCYCREGFNNSDDSTEPSILSDRARLIRDNLPTELVTVIVEFCCSQCSYCKKEYNMKFLHENCCTYSARSVDDDISWFVRPRNSYERLCKGCIKVLEGERGLAVRFKPYFW